MAQPGLFWNLKTMLIYLFIQVRPVTDCSNDEINALCYSMTATDGGCHGSCLWSHRKIFRIYRFMNFVHRNRSNTELSTLPNHAQTHSLSMHTWSNLAHMNCNDCLLAVRRLESGHARISNNKPAIHYFLDSSRARKTCVSKIITDKLIVSAGYNVLWTVREYIDRVNDQLK